MKKFFAQLRPNERRLAVGVLVILIVVLNWWFIWPHFSDWNNLRQRMEAAQKKLGLYQTAIAEQPKYTGLVRSYEGQGQFIPPEDVAINFMRTVQSQAAESGVGISSYARQSTRADQFFTEQSEGIQVIATDAQLVDFLYKLGSSASMVRVHDLELQPDAAKQHLNANIQLVASYQKNAAPATAQTAPVPAKTPANVKTNSKPATAM